MTLPHAAAMRPSDLAPDPAPADDALERPSKTQRKKASHELQDLGEALVALPESRLETLAIPETLRDAVREHRRTRTHEGRRRQMQYIGKLMRGADVEPIRQAVTDMQLGRAKDALALHEAERWRTELIANDDDVTRFMEVHAGVDVQHLRDLIRNARKDAALDARETQRPRLPRAVPVHPRSHARMNDDLDPVRIGVVSVSDRASSGVYEDKGIPALQEWLERAVRNPLVWETRLIPDEQADISAALRELVDDGALRPRAHHRRHRPGAARRHARGDAGRRRQGHAGLRRADAPDQPELRADGDPVAPGRGDPQAGAGHQPARPAEVDRRNARRAADRDAPPVHGIFAAVPYCIDLIGGPWIETRPGGLQGVPAEDRGAPAPHALTRAMAAALRRSIVALLLLAAGLSGPVAAQEPSVEFRISPRDTLIGLSERVFTSRAAWREIARINRLRDPNRIYPGQILRVPVRLMRAAPLPVRVTSTIGDVRVGGVPVEAGATLAEGQSLSTGANASAVLELGDGSRVRVPPASLADVIASRSYGGEADAARAATNGWFSGVLRMVRGSVEVLASKVRRVAPLEVTTPTAVVGVRGTEYRVHFDDAERVTRSEVLDGTVRFESPDRAAGADLRGGYGAALGASAPAPLPTALLAAPDLGAMPALFERPLVRFALPAEKETVRVQVAVDPAFDKIVDDQRVPAGTDVRVANLADARWHLRARRLDGQGIEGFDATRSFVLKARPEPPASNAPRSGAKQPVGAVEFAWSPNIEAASVRLQVARDPAFEDLVLQRDGLTGSSARAEIAEAGAYYWRLASTRADGDRGPFGDPQRFELRPMPEPPKGGVVGRWQDARPGVERAAGGHAARRTGARPAVPRDRRAGRPGRAGMDAADAVWRDLLLPLPQRRGRRLRRPLQRHARHRRAARLALAAAGRAAAARALSALTSRAG